MSSTSSLNDESSGDSKSHMEMCQKIDHQAATLEHTFLSQVNDFLSTSIHPLFTVNHVTRAFKTKTSKIKDKAYDVMFWSWFSQRKPWCAYWSKCKHKNAKSAFINYIENVTTVLETMETNRNAQFCSAIKETMEQIQTQLNAELSTTLMLHMNPIDKFWSNNMKLFFDKIVSPIIRDLVYNLCKKYFPSSDDSLEWIKDALCLLYEPDPLSELDAFTLQVQQIELKRKNALFDLYLLQHTLLEKMVRQTKWFEPVIL